MDDVPLRWTRNGPGCSSVHTDSRRVSGYDGCNSNVVSFHFAGLFNLGAEFAQSFLSNILNRVLMFAYST